MDGRTDAVSLNGDTPVHYGPVFPSLTFGSELMCPSSEAIVISLNGHAILDQYAAPQPLALFGFSGSEFQSEV